MRRLNLYIIRGLPGSGKTTLARRLCPDNNFAADDFFEDRVTGEYRFDPKLLLKAHNDCFRRVWEAMSKRDSDLAVHNTFSRQWEVNKYLSAASGDFGYAPVIIEMQNEWENTHNVPESTIEQMKERWEKVTFGKHLDEF